MSQLQGFGKTAQGLARNPLGIIALFIVLLYAIAGLILGVSVASLQPSERLPLIWFLVIFPLIVLAVFSWLVTKHHKKLYAPSDFKSDDAFLQTLSPEGQRQRLEKEVSEIISLQPAPPETKVPPDGIHTQVVEVRDRLRSEVALAEDLVLRQIEAETGSPILRQRKIKLQGQDIIFDGLIIEEGRIRGIDVRLLRESLVRKNIRNILADVTYMATCLAGLDSKPDVLLLLAVVSLDLTEESRQLVKNRFNEIKKSTPVPVDLRFFDFTELRERFGVTTAHT